MGKMNEALGGKLGANPQDLVDREEVTYNRTLRRVTKIVWKESRLLDIFLSAEDREKTRGCRCEQGGFYKESTWECRFLESPLRVELWFFNDMGKRKSGLMA